MINRIYNAIGFRWRKFFEKEIPAVPYPVKRNLILERSAAGNYNTFIETGTFVGDTVEFFKPHFKKLISIELQPDLAAKARERFLQDSHVEILEGDSAILLKEIVQQLDSPAVFWLDGHYSSEFFVGDQYIVTAKGNKNTPIEKELEIILASNLKHLLLIDDAREFTGRYDYPTLEAVRQIVKQVKPLYKVIVDSDIIQIIPN